MVLVVLALTVAACSSGDGEGSDRQLDDEGTERGRAREFPAVEAEPTAEFLAQAAERSAAQPHRIEVAMHRNHYGEPLSALWGAVDGDAVRYTFDHGAVLEVMADAPGALLADDSDHHLTVDVVVDQSVLFMQIPELVLALEAPGFAEFPPASDETTVQLARLADYMCSVDLGRLGGATAVDVLTALTGQRMDPAAVLGLLSNVDAPVEEGYGPEVRGERMTGLRTQLPLADLMAVTGGAGPIPEGAADVDLVVDVYVDDSGFIRGIDYAVDLQGVAIARGDDPIGLGALEEYEVGYSIDLYDYGDESILIQLSTPTSAEDITDPVAQLLSP